MKTEPKKILSNDLDKSNDKQSLESLMLSNINLKTMMFYLTVCNSKAFPPLSEITSNIDNCLNIFITTGDIEPIQQLTLQTLRNVNIDKLDRMFRAHVNLRLSKLYLAQNDYKEALRYYDRGITYSNIKDFEDIKNDITTYINKDKADKRWSKHNQTRPKKKKQYLQIMDEHNFTTFAETATYIKQHIETGKKPSYRTIEIWLSQASRGDFS